MTRVRTSFGDVHAAALRKGDEVLTRSGEYKPILCTYPDVLMVWPSMLHGVRHC